MAPKATAPQAQVRRSTRSQSREVSATPADARSTRRAQSTEAESSNDVAPAQNNPRRKQRSEKKSAAASKLPVLEEDPTSPIDEEGVRNELLAAVRQSPGAASIVSATTAVTNTTALGGTDKDFDEVADRLPYLHDTAEDLLRTLAPDIATADEIGSIIEELKVPGSKTGAQLRRREETFMFHYDKLTESSYFDPPVFLNNIMRKTTMPKLDRNPWRPDDIVLKANATNLARRLVALERGSSEAYQFIRELDNMFPIFFVSAFGVYPDGDVPSGGSKLRRQTVDLALEIRTQSLIMNLTNAKDDETFDPDETLTQVFFTGSGPSQSQQELRGWNLEQMGTGTPIREQFEQQILQRVQRIRNNFPDNGGDLVNWEALESEFPWCAFQVLVLDWVRMRNRELNERIDDLGGAREIVGLLEDQFYRGMSQRPLSTSRRGTPRSAPQQMGVRTQTSPSINRRLGGLGSSLSPKDNDPSDLALLKAMDKRLSGGSFTQAFIVDTDIPHTVPELLPNVEPALLANTAPAVLPPQQRNNGTFATQQNHDEDDWQPPPDFEDAEPVHEADSAGEGNIPEWQRSTLEAAALRDRQGTEDSRRAQSQPQRRAFIDGQPNAQRVEFGDGFSQASEAVASSSRNANGKRPAQDDDEDNFDPSQDVGFQTDDRNIDTAARRLAAPVPQGRPMGPRDTQSPRKRARFAARVVEEFPVEPDADGEDDYGPAPSAADQYQRVRKLAKANVRAAPPTPRAIGTPGTQEEGDRALMNPRKRRWTPDQEGKLIDYIRDYGCKWAEIKKADSTDNGGLGILTQWSQVDLKDKANNMRVDFHKAGLPLPENFGLITLRARDRQRLASMGIHV